MAKRFLIKEKTAIKLFKALGFKTAGNWTTDRLQSKLNNLPEIADEDKVGEWVQDYLDRIERADEVIIKEKEDKDMKKKKKNKGKGKKKISKATGKKVVEGSTKKKDKKKVSKKTDKKKKIDKKKKDKVSTKKSKGKKKTSKTTTKKTATKKIGVIATIVECLKKGPTTRESILKVLVKRFPDRAEESMNTTVKAAVPSYLRRKQGLFCAG